MPVNLFSTSTGGGGDEEQSMSARRRRSQMLGQLLAQQTKVPITSTAQGIGTVLLNGVGGFLEGQELAKSEADRKELAKSVLVAAGVSGAPPSSPIATLNSGTAAPSIGARVSSVDTGNDRPDVASLKAALAPMESGGRYDIKGPMNAKYGSPLGKYQIMASNLPEWSQAAVGRTVSQDEFLKSPDLQEQIAGHRMGTILDKYGNLQDAASVWHSGRPLAQATAAGARDVNMSTADYVARTVGRQRTADMPAPGSAPVGMNPMGDQDGGPESGYFIPPAPQSAPVPPVAVDPDRMAQSFPNLASPGPAALPADAGTMLPGITVEGGAPPIPLPPSRPADLGMTVSPERQALAQAVMGGAPLPPPRPDFANMPAPDAQPVAAQLGAMLARQPDLSNSDTGGAREFTMGQSDPKALAAVLSNYAPGQGGTSGAPDRMALARAVAGPSGIVVPPATTALARAVSPETAAPMPQSAPQTVISPNVSVGPAPGPNGPVAAPIAAPVTASTADPRRAALVGIISNPEASSAQQAWALGQLNPKVEHVDLGDSIGMVGPNGKLIGQIAKTKIPTYGVTGKDQYGNESYGFIDPSNMRVVPGPTPAAGGQVLPGQPGSTIPAPPPGVDPKIWREAQSKNAVADALPVDPKQTAEVRKEVLSLPSYKNVKQASPVYRAMVDTAGTDTKASDLNLIYGMGKIMDPGSVVREGEMALAQGTSGLDDRLKGFANSVFGGARLTPDTRASLLAEAHGRMKSYEDEFDADSQHYRGIAQRGRMNENDVVPTYERSKAWTPPAKTTTVAPAPANDGWTDVGGVKIRKKN